MPTISASRRHFLRTSGLAAGAYLLHRWLPAIAEASADYTIRIQTVPIEIAPNRIIGAPPTTANFPARCCASKKVSPSPSTSSTTPTRPSSSTGTARKSPPTSTAPPKKARPGSPPTATAAFRSRPTRLACASTTPTTAPAPISTPANTADKSAPFTSSPKTTPGRYDREVFLTLKEFEPTFSRGGDMAMNFLAGAPDRQLQQQRRVGHESLTRQRHAARLRSRLRLLHHQRTHARPRRSHPRQSQASACCSTSSTAAPPKFAASRFPATSSRSSHSTATPCPIPRQSPCSGSAPPSASPPSSR